MNKLEELINKYEDLLTREQEFKKTFQNTPPSLRVGSTSLSDINLGIIRYEEILRDLKELRGDSN